MQRILIFFHPGGANSNIQVEMMVLARWWRPLSEPLPRNPPSPKPPKRKRRRFGAEAEEMKRGVRTGGPPRRSTRLKTFPCSTSTQGMPASPAACFLWRTERPANGRQMKAQTGRGEGGGGRGSVCRAPEFGLLRLSGVVDIPAQGFSQCEELGPNSEIGLTRRS